jgi:hypothetical protein
MAPENDKSASANANDANEDRRKFLAACGKFAIVTPPAITMLLSTSLTSSAIAHSSGQGNNGHGRGRGHGNNNSGGSSEWHKNNGIRSNRSSFWDWDFDNDRRRKFVKRQDTGRM